MPHRHPYRSVRTAPPATRRRRATIASQPAPALPPQPHRQLPPKWTLADVCTLIRDGQDYSGPAAAYRILWEQLPPPARVELARLASAGADQKAARRAAARLRALLSEQRR